MLYCVLLCYITPVYPSMNRSSSLPVSLRWGPGGREGGRVSNLRCQHHTAIQHPPDLNDARLQPIARQHKCPFLVPSSAELSSARSSLLHGIFLSFPLLFFPSLSFPLIFILLRFLLAFFEISFCSARASSRVESSGVESNRVESVLIYSIPYIFIELRHIHLLAKLPSSP